MSKSPINIASATQTGEYRIRLVFEDDTVQEVDFKLVWGDYALCFPIADLYHNTIEHRQIGAVAA